MHTIQFDPHELRAIAAGCKESSERVLDEVTSMMHQVRRLEDVMVSIPDWEMTERFQQLEHVMAQAGTTLEESDAYIRSIVSRVEMFVAALESLR